MYYIDAPLLRAEIGNFDRRKEQKFKTGVYRGLTRCKLVGDW